MALRFLAGNAVPVAKDEKTTSQSKVEASRQSAHLSTGPTSVEGKKTSSRNASKHNLLTKDVVVTTGPGREDQGQFDALFADLCDSYSPIGFKEELLVQELANSYWRSARAGRCERGDLTCAAATQWATPDESELTKSEIDSLRHQDYGSLIRSSRGIKFLLLVVKQAQDEVRGDGFFSTHLKAWLAPGKLWVRSEFSSKKLFLAAFDKEIERLTAEKGLVERNEAQLRNAQCDRRAIPEKDVLDRIHRYETSNLRHRYKVEARLDQLQARRRENAKVNSGDSNDAENSQEDQFCETKPTGSDDGGLRKGPHSVGLARQKSDDSATPPLKPDVAAV